MPAQTAVNDTDNGDRQFARARDELERCLRAGQPCDAQQLLAACPALAADPEGAVDLICAEFFLRRELGEAPDPTSWCARFPQWRERLRQRLPASDTPEQSTVAEATAALSEETPRPAVSLPSAFGRYVVDREIGRGGMGIVWQARDPVLGRLVALKTIREGRWAGTDDVERFYREARAAAQLKHPHIIEIFDIDRDGDEHYFAMEHAAGGSLSRCQERYRADPHAAAALIEKVARAVQHAHERGVIHRDLKPSNILLDEHGEPKVSDFGLARLTSIHSDLTRPGQALGTPAYMAPEQAEGRATERSDVWALGVILYELLTGRRPFSGRTSEELTNRIRTAEPGSPRSLVPRLGRDLETIILTCLEKDPARRYASAGALADDLARWQSGDPIQARRPGLLRRARRLVRRHPALSTAVVMLLVFAAGTALAAPYLPYFKKAPPPVSREPIHFIGPDGLQHASGKWIVGAGKLTPQGDGVLRVDSPKDVALLELKDRPPWPRYRFRVEVQQAGPRSSAIGIYFGYQPKMVGGATADHWFYAWTFAEQNIYPPTLVKGKMEAGTVIEAYRLSDHPAAGLRYCYRYAASTTGPGIAFFFAKRGAWRQLTLDVAPEAVNAIWGEGKTAFITFGPDAVKARRQELANMSPTDPAPPPASTAGGLGICCEKGSLLFRNAVLEPLPEGP